MWSEGGVRWVCVCVCVLSRESQTPFSLSTSSSSSWVIPRSLLQVLQVLGLPWALLSEAQLSYSRLQALMKLTFLPPPTGVNPREGGPMGLGLATRRSAANPTSRPGSWRMPWWPASGWGKLRFQSSLGGGLWAVLSWSLTEDLCHRGPCHGHTAPDTLTPRIIGTHKPLPS